MRLPHIITDDRVSVSIDNRFRSFSRSDFRGKRLVELLDQKDHDVEAIREAADLPTYLTKHSLGRVTIDDRDQVRLDGRIVDLGVADTLLDYLHRGADVTSLVYYIERVVQNPSDTIASDLYRFLKSGNLPLTPDGCFLAFKGVDSRFRSKHRGNEDVTVTFDYAGRDLVEQYQDRAVKELGLDPSVDGLVNYSNTQVFRGHIPHPIGATLEMSASDVDRDPRQNCSRGLHCCSAEYLNWWYNIEDKVLIVKVYPEAVAAIPSHDNDQKLRTARYTVLDEMNFEDRNIFFSKPVDTRYEPEDEDWDHDELDDVWLADNEPDDDDDFVTVTDEEIDAFVQGIETESEDDDSFSATPVDRVEDDDQVVVSLTADEAARWRKIGYAIGEDDGEGDLESGADYDSTCPDDLEVLPHDNAAAMSEFRAGYAEGYEIGYGDAPDIEPEPGDRVEDFTDQLTETAIAAIKAEANDFGFHLGQADREAGAPMDCRIERVAEHAQHRVCEGQAAQTFDGQFAIAYLAGFFGTPKPEEA